MPTRLSCRRACITAFTLALFLAAGGVAKAGCAVGNFQFQPNESKTVVMTVTRLTKCTMTLAPGASVSFDSLDITTQPHHGHLGFDGTRSISFTPGSSYVGPDAFTFEVISHQGTTKSTAVISVFVTIQ